MINFSFSFRCSAGVAHGKTLSKLGAGINKPNRQTVLPQGEVEKLFSKTKVGKLWGLGGKLGTAVVEDLHCETLADLAKLSMPELRARFDAKTSLWLHNISRGKDDDPVKARDLPKSIGCSKAFAGPKMLDTSEKVEFWLTQLAEEVCERLTKDRSENGRVATGINVSVAIEGGGRHMVSRAGALKVYDSEAIARHAKTLIGGMNEAAARGNPELWRPKLRLLSISATKFEDDCGEAGKQSIQEMFQKLRDRETPANCEAKDEGKDQNAQQDVEAELGVLDGARAFADEAEVNRPTFSMEDAAELTPCEKCNKLVSPFDLPEHLDYHVARELQSELSREVRAEEESEAAKSRPRPAVTNPTKASRKRPRRAAAASDQPGAQDKKQKNILSFFKPA